MRSTALGLRNIRRTIPLLMAAALRRGEDNSELSELYDRLLDQWTQELEHVAAIVGGADSREKYGGQLGPRFMPIEPARQRAAVDFLAASAFTTPDYLIDPQILRRIEADGALRRIGSAQARVLEVLLDIDRLNRLSEYEALARNRRDVYTLGEMLGDVRRAIWTELGSPAVSVDPFRRRLQRSWLSQADSHLNPAPAVIITPSPARRTSRGRSSANSDVRALVRGELMDLDSSIVAALARTRDRTTRLHLLDARAEIKRILDPEA